MRTDHTHFKCSSNSQSSDLRGKKKKFKFSNCHNCKPFNTHRPMTSWKAHGLQLYVKPTFTHFPVKQTNCYRNQQADLHTIKEGILNTFFTFINTKASSRTENQCNTRRRMQVSCFLQSNILPGEHCLREH